MQIPCSAGPSPKCHWLALKKKFSVQKEDQEDLLIKVTRLGLSYNGYSSFEQVCLNWWISYNAQCAVCTYSTIALYTSKN